MVTVLLVIAIITGGSLWHQLNDTKIQLTNATAQLNAVKPGMDSLKAEQDQILSSYANLRRQINLRTGIEHDSQCFITPDAPEISAKVQEITGGYSEEELWKDYERLFQWIGMNTEYNLDSPTPFLPEAIDGTLEWGTDFWRMPVETLRDGAGDCEDTALLLASMLLNYNQRKFPVWIVGVKTPGSPPKAHVAVAIPSKNNQLTIFDIAAHYYTPYTPSPIPGLGSKDIPQAIDHWLTYLERKLPSAQIYIAFSEDFYQEFSSTQEFVDWVSKLLT